MKMSRNLGTAIAAAAIALTAAAFAADRKPGPDAMKSEAPAKAGAAMKDGAMAGASAKPAMPPKSIVGKDVNNTKGEKVGQVSKVAGRQVVVSVGGFLGLGARQVALNWEQLSMLPGKKGNGEDTKLMTSLSEADLKSLPEYREQAPAARN